MTFSFETALGGFYSVLKRTKRIFVREMDFRILEVNLPNGITRSDRAKLVRGRNESRRAVAILFAADDLYVAFQIHAAP